MPLPSPLSPPIDVSARITDPLDEFRLFDMARDRELAASLVARALPAGPCQGVLVAPACYELADGAASVAQVNDFVLAEARAGPAIVAAFGVTEPRFEASAIAELQRLAAGGAKGIAWSPRAQGLLADDGLMAEMCRAAAGLGLVSLISTQPHSANEALWRILDLAARCPEATFIISGALQSWDNVRVIAAGGAAPANVHYDTAGWTVSTGLAGLLPGLGARHLLFGTAGIEPAAPAAARLAAMLAAAGVPADGIALVMGGNARRLLGLEAGA